MKVQSKFILLSATAIFAMVSSASVQAMYVPGLNEADAIAGKLHRKFRKENKTEDQLFVEEQFDSRSDAYTDRKEDKNSKTGEQVDALCRQLKSVVDTYGFTHYDKLMAKCFPNSEIPVTPEKSEKEEETTVLKTKIITINGVEYLVMDDGSEDISVDSTSTTGQGTSTSGQGTSTPVKHTQANNEGKTPVKHTQANNEGKTPVKHTQANNEGKTPVKHTQANNEGKTPVKHTPKRDATELKPLEMKPLTIKPAEIKLVVSKPVELKPTVAKPVEQKFVKLVVRKNETSRKSSTVKIDGEGSKNDTKSKRASWFGNRNKYKNKKTPLDVATIVNEMQWSEKGISSETFKNLSEKNYDAIRADAAQMNQKRSSSSFSGM